MYLLVLVVLIQQYPDFSLGSKLDEFEYTEITWQIGQEVETRHADFFRNDVDKISEWPQGPFALLMPTTGCPETVSHGWTYGTMHFVWRKPHNSISSTNMNGNDCNTKTADDNDHYKTRNTTKNECFFTLVEENWPEPTSNILGPFNRFSFQLNFCVKRGDNATGSSKILDTWPSGSYGIFAVGKCPAGFKSKRRVINLPELASWFSRGSLPNYTVSETNNTTTLVFTICEHQLKEEKNESSVTYNSVLRKEPSSLIKTDEGACVEIEETVTEEEALYVDLSGTEIEELEEVLRICYYRPLSWNTEREGYLYLPGDEAPLNVFAVNKPSATHGNRTLRMKGNFKQNENDLLPGQGMTSTKVITWLLVDLGRAFSVSDAIFPNYALEEEPPDEYIGTLNYLPDGRKCERWDVVKDDLSLDDSDFIDGSVIAAENFCRDAMFFKFCIWCKVSSQRVECCAMRVYRYISPFSKLFIGNDRWALWKSGAIELSHIPKVTAKGALAVNFLKIMSGRFILFVSSDVIDQTTFYQRTSDVQVVLHGEVQRTEHEMCYTDLGMWDESIQDKQISASSQQGEFVPQAARPYKTGWCADQFDENPFITVDLIKPTSVEGITIWNWETVSEYVNDMMFNKRFLPLGVKTFKISYRLYGNETWTTKNTDEMFSFETFYPTDYPQKFVFKKPIYARFIKIQLIQPMTSTYNCMRFELSGCLHEDAAIFPPLVYQYREDIYLYQQLNYTTVSLVQWVHKEGVLTSVGFPLSYQQGVQYLWSIDFHGDGFVSAVFTSMSFTMFKGNQIDNCKDRILISDGNEINRNYYIEIDHQYHNRIIFIETSTSLVFLTFITCQPTSEMLASGSGFRALLSAKDVPNCFSLRSLDFHSDRKEQCEMPSMYIMSLPVFNIPIADISELWTLHVKAHTFRLEIIDFYVRCVEGTKLSISDRFADDVKEFCNLAKPPKEVYSESDTMTIAIIKGPTAESSLGIDVRERFKAIYTSLPGRLAKFNLLKWTNFYAIRKLSLTDSKAISELALIDSASKLLVELPLVDPKVGEQWYENDTFFAYRACSRTFNKCYSIYSGSVVSWKMAGYECWIRKKKLVSFNSHEELDMVKQMLRNFRYIDIGDEHSIETIFVFDNPDPYYFSHIGKNILVKKAHPLSSIVRTLVLNNNVPKLLISLMLGGDQIFCGGSVVKNDGYTVQGLMRVRNNKGVVQHVWDNGLPLTFAAWNKNEPSPNGDCTRMSFHLGHYNDTWESEDCLRGRAKYFVCDQDMPEYTTILTNDVAHSYSGTLNTTVSGITCQRWDQKFPHYFYKLDAHYFPEETVSAAENYCRDPDRSGYIWCYTLDPLIRREACESHAYDEIIPQEYSGKLSRTASGKTCQRWATDYPHKKTNLDVNMFPEETFDDAANYCRDPYEQSRLWCYTTNPSRPKENCFFFETASDRCFSTHFLYSGQWNKTVTGKTCQHWNATSPHDHEEFLDSQFPDESVVQAENFCRDPYSEGYLWCFTTDPGTRSEPCQFDYKYQLEESADPLRRTNNTFVCDISNVIPYENVCNGKVDCLDVSDESNCTKKAHKLLESQPISRKEPSFANGILFQCESKEWLYLFAKCDGVIDCADMSDERDCLYFSQDALCSSTQFQCDDGGCIHISQMCDFIADCNDSSDEDCDHPLCSNSEYRCGNGQCIPVGNVCDAYEQCIDGTDEQNCAVCRDESFSCDKVRCIPKRLVCDKYPDCDDMTDEETCAPQVYTSCDDVWIAGFQKNGFYILTLNSYKIEVECDFSKVDTDGKIYTINHYTDLYKGHGDLSIHSKDLYILWFPEKAVIEIMNDEKYSCSQNITQTCIAAHQAAAETDDQDHKGEFSHCKCIVMTVMPFNPYSKGGTIKYCHEDVTPADEHLLFFEYKAGWIVLENGAQSNIEITLGPLVCSSEAEIINKTIKGCPIGSNTLDETIRCVYNKDPSGFTVGCRSGSHLQGCHDFECPQNTVKCPNTFCLPLLYVCDGDKQCPGGEDEHDCGCVDEAREVVIMTEHDDHPNLNMLQIAKQFSTPNTIVRVLRYSSRTRPETIEFDHRILDIFDTEINPYDLVNREHVCKYSVRASDFINSIRFSKNESRGLVFLQTSDEARTVANLMFKDLKSPPDFYIYRVVEHLKYSAANIRPFRYVTETSVKRWSDISSIGSSFFPNVCKKGAAITCPNEFKCSSSKACITIDQLCDGHAQCLNHDDERLCQSTCPVNCSCVGFAADCRAKDFNYDSLDRLDRKTRLLDLSGQYALFKGILQYQFINLPYLTVLNLSICQIKDVFQQNFQDLNNLLFLDLSFNRISRIRTSTFFGLRRLKSLNLNGNTDIEVIEPRALQGLANLRNLQIIESNIQKISSYAFYGLKLEKLTLANNSIQEVENFAFGELTVKSLVFENRIVTKFDRELFTDISQLETLRTSAYKFCCVRPRYLPENRCTPEKDEFSSCDDLMRISALQVLIWLMGICALLGNILSVIYRLLYDRSRLKIGFGIFVTNLAVADFFMGVYLAIIASADAVYSKRYIFMDDIWRNSAWCTLAGVLSTMSSEASVFFLCLITLDRFLVIKYPFSQIRFNPMKAIVCSTIVWIISFFISVFPLVHKGYFQNRFYTKSGVCIALPLTRDRPPGWIYSIIIFLGLNFITFILIAIGQLLIYVEMTSVSKRVRMDKSTKGSSRSTRRTELAVARNLLLVVMTDFMCWFPIGFMGIMALTGHVVPGVVYAWTAVFILPVNSAINPLLYTATTLLAKRRQRSKVRDNNRNAQDNNWSRKHLHIKGLFRYYMTTRDSYGQTFINLDDIACKDMELTTKTVCKIAFELIKCLRILHINSLAVVKLENDKLYTTIKYGEIMGDIQLRQEPLVCESPETKSEDIYKYGTVLRSLLMRFIRSTNRARK